MDVHVRYANIAEKKLKFSSSEHLGFVESQLDLHGLDFEYMIDDLGDAVNRSLENVQTKYAGLDDFDYENYGTWEVYQQWQKDFVAANSDIASEAAYGLSYEKRELNYIKLGKGSKKIVLHGGTHAREWISHITMINMAKQLVDEYRAGTESAKYLEDITWYIHVSMNPGKALIDHQVLSY